MRYFNRFLFIGLLCWFAATTATALASVPVRLFSVSQAAEAMANAVSGCPNYNGPLDSVIVPIEEPIELFLSGRTAPEDGAHYEVRVDDSSIVAVGDARQGFLPNLTIPEGESISQPFTVHGIRIGRTRLKLEAKTSGYNTIEVPIGAWDVGEGGEEKFLDANRPDRHCRAGDDSPTLSSDETKLADCGAPIKGIVTDGVSRLLLRTRSGLEGTACYEVIPAGSVEDSGSVDTDVKRTTLVNNINQASSFYRAPESFEETGNSRRVEVEFTFTPSIGNGNTSRFRAEVTLVRPPVVLIHGLWSDEHAWENFFVRNDDFHTTVRRGYGGTNDASFSVNVPNAKAFIEEAIEKSREDKQYATTQVDVIAHSMGGLLARLYAQDPDYTRPDNLNEGDIHRLLTLNTPHFGSSFANLIVALHNAEPGTTKQIVDDLVPGDARIVNGSVCDLAENSQALQQLAGGTTVHAHAITSTGGPAGTPDTPAKYWEGFASFSNFEAALIKERCVPPNLPGDATCFNWEFDFPQDIVDGHRFREANDAIVPASSQRAGLLGSEINNFPNLLHFGVGALVNGVTNTQAVADRAFAVLDEANSTGAWADRFPGVSSNGTGATLTVPGVPNGTQIFSTQCRNGGPMKPAEALAATDMQLAALEEGDPRIRIVEPVEGQLFAPGDTVRVLVAIEPPLIPSDIRVGVDGFGQLGGTDYDGATYQAEFTLPDPFAGPLEMTPAITDQNNEFIAGTPTTIGVRPVNPPKRIYVNPDIHYLDLSRGETDRVSVTGVYPGNAIHPDDISVNISTAIAGTQYQSSDPGIVTVDADGHLTPLSPGTAVITANHMGLAGFSLVRVHQGSEPLPPADMTAELQIDYGGFRLNRHTGFFVQSVRITNPTDLPIIGPLNAVVSGLPAGMELMRKDSITRNLPPVGSPYFRLPLRTDGLSLYPGESVELLLEFLNPERQRINYDLQVIRTREIP